MLTRFDLTIVLIFPLMAEPAFSFTHSIQSGKYYQQCRLSNSQNFEYKQLMADYQKVVQKPQAAQGQRSYTELARRLKEMLVEDNKEKEELNDQSQFIKNIPFKKPLFTVNDMESTFLTMDKSLLYVGDNSTFQKRITWILAIQWISFSFMVNSMAYFFRSPNFSCRVPLTDIFYACSQISACKLHPGDYKVLDGAQWGQISIVQEFHLYCQQAGRIYTVQGLFFLGGFISGFLLSYISQRIGRRPVILSVLILSIVSMLMCAWAPTFQFFFVSYFFTGFFLFGYETTVYIYISEISAVRFKTISINMLTMVWAGAPMALFLLGMIPTWRYSFIFFAVIWFITMPFAYLCFLESPRFLLTKKCYSQISITNKRPPYRFKLMEEMQLENQGFLRLRGDERMASAKSEWAEVKQYNYCDLLRFGSVKKATLLLMYLWIFRYFMYFALNLALESVLQSSYVLTMAISLSSFFEVVGTFGIPFMTFFSKRMYTSIEIIQKCVASLTILCCGLWFLQVNKECKVFQDNNTFCLQILAMIMLVNLIKFTNSVFFSALVTYSMQVYPTVVRSLGYGFTMTFGRMSTLLVPFYINWMRSKYENRNALSFLAPIGLLGYLFCLCAGDMFNGMKDTIPEEEEELRLNRDVREIQLALIPRISRKKDEQNIEFEK